jgi:hypothetical protein
MANWHRGRPLRETLVITGDIVPRRINWAVVASNLADAREGIERLEAVVAKRRGLNEVALQLSLEHAYHHLNVAWNARHASSKQYSQLTDAQFNRWAKFPKGVIEEYRVERKRKRDD